MSCPDHITPEAYEWAEIFMDAHRGVEDDRELLALAFMDLRPNSAGLTQKQVAVINFIEGSISKHGFSPTYEEIAEGVGFRHKGRVCTIVDQLEERGLVRRLPHRARSIALVGRA